MELADRSAGNEKAERAGGAGEREREGQRQDSQAAEGEGRGDGGTGAEKEGESPAREGEGGNVDASAPVGCDVVVQAQAVSGCVGAVVEGVAMPVTAGQVAATHFLTRSAMSGADTGWSAASGGGPSAAAPRTGENPRHPHHHTPTPSHSHSLPHTLTHPLAHPLTHPHPRSLLRSGIDADAVPSSLERRGRRRSLGRGSRTGGTGAGGGGRGCRDAGGAAQLRVDGGGEARV
eukprot:3075822-Rhodomonas_salina.1